MPDFEWYRSFIAVYRGGTVTRAAEVRNLTQPAVSQHLAALENAVGGTLFERTARRMVATDLGHRLYRQAAPAVDALECMATTLTGDGELPPLRLGAPSDYFHYLLLPRLAGAALRLHATFGDTEGLLARLVAGELDAVVATRQQRSAELEFRKLGEESFILVTPPGLKTPGDEGEESPRDTWERFLASQNWISYGVELPIIRRYWQSVFGRRPAFETTHVIPNLSAIGRAVEEGLGVSVLPCYLCAGALEQGRLRCPWEPGGPVTNELWLSFRRVDKNRPEIGRFCSLLLARTFYPG